MVKVYGMVNIHTEDMTNMEIDQNKTYQLLGQMKTGLSSNMENGDGVIFWEPLISAEERTLNINVTICIS